MKRRDLLLMACGLAAAAPLLQAQTAPMRILVGAPAGGTTDTMARTLATELGKLLGRVVIVENRPGAGGNIAADAVAGRQHIVDEFHQPRHQRIAVSGVNIPYRGTAPAVQDVLAGQIEMMFANIGNVQAHLRAGKLKGLGVTSSKRLVAFPDVPAIAEVLPGYESSAWFGLFGPGHMDPALTKRISDAARQAIATPEVRRRIQAEGATPVGNSPEEFGRFVHAESQRWAKVVKFSGAKPE
jgi:tripartite-type tricarboxylate transporter receptor subunit TctC